MGTSMGHHTKVQKIKMEYEEEGKGCHTKMRPKSRGHITLVHSIHQNATTYFKITKMSL